MQLTGTVIRILFGGLLVFAAVAYFFNLIEQPIPTGAIATMNAGFVAMGYLVPLVKCIELLCGIGLLLNKFPRLLPILLFPISLNIFLIHLCIDRHNLAIGCFVLGANTLLLLQQRAHYRNLFAFNA